MKKVVEHWTVAKLKTEFAKISFPEYQREPNLWSRREKQRLIDSMVRQFDIASLYMYKNEDGELGCVDGRQRLNAIMSFLGKNPHDKEDNEFPLENLNEIYEDEGPAYKSLLGKKYREIDKAEASGINSKEADDFISGFLGYRFTVVVLSESSRAEEFNLQFIRLNLGVIINSGEKLHAMVGDLRDVCFNENGLGQHEFWQTTKFPIRRYAKEQVAAQILAQVFSYAESQEFRRTRHFDLQRLFNDYTKLRDPAKGLVERVRKLLDLLHESFGDAGILRNRAVTVSVVLLAWTQDVRTSEEAKRLTDFVRRFQRELATQVKKNYDADPGFRYLLEFQRHLTQASVEKPGVTERARILDAEFEHWKETGKLRGELHDGAR